MATPATTTSKADAEVPDLAEINGMSMTMWKRFTGFLLWNVIACIVALIVIGLLTVWS